MAAKIRIVQALLFNNGSLATSTTVARVEWEGPNGPREKETPHDSSWVKKLARIVDSDLELREASVNKKLDVRGPSGGTKTS